MIAEEQASQEPEHGSAAEELPASTELLIVGPAGYRTDGTGGIGRYIAEQQRYLEDRLSLDVVDTAV